MHNVDHRDYSSQPARKPCRLGGNIPSSKQSDAVFGEEKERKNLDLNRTTTTTTTTKSNRWKEKEENQLGSGSTY